MKKTTKIIIPAFIILLLVIAAGVIYSKLELNNDDTGLDYMTIVENEKFQQLVDEVINFDGLSNLAVLPREGYIVLNDKVIDMISKTYGDVPVLTFYDNYYESASKNSIDNMQSFLTNLNDNFTEEKINDLIVLMKTNDVVDILVDNKVDQEDPTVMFRWKASAMWGEEGIIYSTKDLQSLNEFDDSLVKIKDNFYYFFKD